MTIAPPAISGAPQHWAAHTFLSRFSLFGWHFSEPLRHDLMWTLELLNAG
jgi:hypothetical protein